jgi:predicted amidophosphoribosyltransferase
MPLRIVSFATYLSNTDVKWRSDDFNANKFIKALKEEPINKHAWIPLPLGGILRKLQQSNSEKAFEWFAEWAAEYIEEKKKARPLALVPIPGSTCGINGDLVPRTRRLADELAKRLKKVQVWDGLRWKEVMPSAHSMGGTRDPQELFDNLAITEKLPDAELVLIDDVFTTGAHLQAAVAILLQ